MSFRTGEALFANWQADIFNPNPAPEWSSGDPIFADIEVGPGRIILLGGPPGAGKTALIGQWTSGILANSPDV